MQLHRDYCDFFDIHDVDPPTLQQVRHDVDAHLPPLLRHLGASEDDARRLADALWDPMTQPDRHYHTPVHVLAMFCYAERAGAELSDPEQLAIWFHDAIYDPVAPPGRNENETADWMRRLLLAAGLPRPTVDQAADAIRWTARHLDEHVPPEHRLIMDLDLAGLTAEPENFERQSRAVRLEAGHLSEEKYRSGKIYFFEQLLARPHFFRSEAFAPWEQRARQAVKQEIEKLRQPIEPTDA